MKFSKLVSMVSDVLNDLSNVTWSLGQVRDWLVEAELATISAREDAAANTAIVSLLAGTKQSIPIDGVKLLSVIRNMGDGSAPGIPIRLVARDTKDECDYSWHSEAQSAVIYEYIFDDRTPKEFYVSPPAQAGTNIEISYVKLPASYDFNTDPDISISDTFAPAIVEWSLYRCFSRSDEDTPEFARAIGHYESWSRLLSFKLQSDMQVSPKSRGHLK